MAGDRAAEQKAIREYQSYKHPRLAVLDHDAPHTFKKPLKRINDGQDMDHFLRCRGYTSIMTFILQLDKAMFPSKGSTETKGVQMWELGTTEVSSLPIIKALRSLLNRFEEMIAEAPLDSGPQRFGNVSFRKWYQIVEERSPQLLREYIPTEILEGRNHASDGSTAEDELLAYLLGSFGSAQRIDYGTGHELSFLAFLGCLWKLGAFSSTETGESERAIVLNVLEPYFSLVRRLILTYNLEPAGSHGVWGLDDHSFLPYIFGSAQLGPVIGPEDAIPTEGSAPSACDPLDVTKAATVEREREKNLYFSAIGFIYDVKKGPFWEHSSTLFNISGVKAGWAKINKGMLKMYDAEVLSKFPVVQHFPFGSLFSWDADPDAQPKNPSSHSSSLPQTSMSARPQGMGSGIQSVVEGSTKAPWASKSDDNSRSATLPNVPTRAPWIPQRNDGSPNAMNQETTAASTTFQGQPSTKAPWLNNESSKSRINTLKGLRAPSSSSSTADMRKPS